MSNNSSYNQEIPNPILDEGMGTPYLAVFDGFQKPIIDPVSQLPIGVFLDNFIYEYNEDKEDSGSFVLITGNPNLGDIPQLSYYMPLFLQWGYILADGTVKASPLRKVMIIGNNTTFGQEGVSIEILFADAASILLKNSPAKYFSDPDIMGNDEIEYWTYLLRGSTVGITILDYQEKLVLEPKVLEKQN